MIVVDVGCAAHGEDVSIGPLIERFHPRILYGFDPHPTVLERQRSVNGTTVVLERKAAWTEDGFVGFVENGIRSQVHEGAAMLAPCFDFAAWLDGLPWGEEIVVKVDAEGAEYELLPRLHDAGLDERLSLLLVEWHGGQLDINFRCPVEAWA